MYSTTLNPTAEQIIREHGEKDFPNECVGFLYGTEKDGDKKYQNWLDQSSTVKKVIKKEDLKFLLLII
jgi:proteasome lid subunit RPN8/RPN11